jgi:hypothetical protein
MVLKDGINAINEMLSDRVIENYAVAGDAAASHYLPSISARFMEVVVPFPGGKGQLIVSPTKIFEYLIARGAFFEGQNIRMGDTPTLFVPPSTPLLEEALREAVVRQIDGTTGRIFTADYLAALAFQSGRANQRLLDLAAADVLDVDHFQAIISRHGLLDRWKEFLRNQR